MFVTNSHDSGVQLGRALSMNYDVKPRRTVFEPGMVVHVWAQQTQAYGRNAKGSIYFEGPTLYSYGSHWVIAKFAKADVVLINSGNTSVTTNRHTRFARHATRHYKRFSVPFPEANSPEVHSKNLENLISNAEAHNARMRNTRVSPENRAAAAWSLKTAASVANDYKKEFFPRRRLPAYVVPEDVSEIINENRVKVAAKKFLAAEVAYSDAFSAPTTLRMTLGQLRNVVSQATNYRNVCREVGVNLPTFSLDFRKVLRLWRYARKAYHAQRDVDTGLNHARYASPERKIYTAQGSFNYRQEIRGYAPHGYDTPKGYKEFDRFVREMITSDEAERRTAKYEEESRKSEERYNENLRRQAASRAHMDTPLDEALEAWIAGEINTIPRLHYAPCKLRHNEKTGEVETSHGASFPVKDAITAWPHVRALIERGEAWTGAWGTRAIRLGHFKIEAVTKEGDLRAGCHTLARNEIERFAGTLGLL